MKITDLIGKTPLVDLSNICPNPNVKMYGKLEGNNPGSSVKDRAAYNMIKMALERGDINQDTMLVEPTSGNTGIALAMVARMMNISLELIMPENASRERVTTMEAFGAKVVLTSAKESMEGAIDYARKRVAEGCYMLDQFSNQDNPDAHYKTTGPEIWEDTQHEVTHFVSAMGTTGTIMGTSKFLKEQNPNIQIVGCQPTDGSNIPGIRRWPQEYLPSIFDASRVDRIMDVSEYDATMTTRLVAAKEGVFCGMSAGGAVWAAAQVAKEIETGVIVCIICDKGDRYLSTELFA